MMGRMPYHKQISLPKVDKRTAAILWRDFLFLVLGSVALSIISYVETHAADADARMSSDSPSKATDSANSLGIVDTGFILTSKLHELLGKNRDLNDLLAALNSIALLIPGAYISYVTVWIGDYSLPFRILSTQLLRSYCGWFTYLPPEPTYLPSYYDFPDIVQCLFQDCVGAPKVLPFVSFFSGHVATMVIAGNHMWMRGYRNLAVLIHTVNAFQIVRLLATRGHYSIDIIIGWYVAVFVTNRAAHLGRYYSRGNASLHEIMPATPSEAFEAVTGVKVAQNDERMSRLIRRKDVQEFLLTIDEEEMNKSESSETTARIIQERMYAQYTSYMGEEKKKGS